MKRKFNKGDKVKIYGHGGAFLADGIVHGWTYHRDAKKYHYLVGRLDNKSRAYFEASALMLSDEQSEKILY